MTGFSIAWDEQGGATVVRDGHPQSYVDPTDPTVLAFEYVAQLAAVVDALVPAGRVRITHVGGAGLSLPRWIEHTRPGSPQIVLEPDAALTDLVRRELPLPRGHRIRVRPLDGLTGVAALADASAEVVVLDAYADGRVPGELATIEFLTDVARVLTPGGLLLANLADDRTFRWVPRVAVAARAALGYTAFAALTDVTRGRRFGNGILIASRAPVDTDEVARALRRLPFPSGVLTDRELARRSGGLGPFTAAAPEPSPEPPDPGRWRAR